MGIWGFGREGRSALRLLRERVAGARPVVVTDAPLTESEQAALAALAPGVAAHHGPAGIAELTRCDVVVRSPGLSVYRPEVAVLRASGVRITSGTNLWFAEHATDQVVAVTGTKGKSTTSALTAHLLRSDGRRVELAGNIGRPLLDLFDAPASPTVYVVELSSYQTSDLVHAPSIGVLLNLYREHTDWHGSQEQYFADKMHLIEHGDVRVVANAGDPELRRRLRGRDGVQWFGGDTGFHVVGDRILDGGEVVVAAEDMHLVGRHNLLDACAALTVARLCGVAREHWHDAVATFLPLPHRLQVVCVSAGIRYVDDSISTIPEAAMAAVDAVSPAPVSLILGGHDREQEYGLLAERLVEQANVVGVVGLPDNGPQILDAIRIAGIGGARVLAVEMAGDMDGAVCAARRMLGGSGVVLLSPAAPSYGHYRNFEERGDAFALAARTPCPP